MAKEVATGIEALAQQADNLETLSTGPDAPGQGGAAEEVAPAVPTNAEIIGGAVQMVRDVLCMVLDLKTPASTLHDGNCQHLGALWGAVADKRGLDLNSMMGDYAAEVAAVVGTVVIGQAVMRGARAELAARAPVDVEEKPAQPGGEDVAQ
nr:hypothetical protein [uncultured Albidiferax sp.]